MLVLMAHRSSSSTSSNIDCHWILDAQPNCRESFFDFSGDGGGVRVIGGKASAASRVRLFGPSERRGTDRSAPTLTADSSLLLDESAAESDKRSISMGSQY
eukprot:GDKK01002015.1.p1 GENE.GDKK01002015.1~~GDKK01002015.1.p1  ORF type:complete len:101 (-),score=2.76 GDKK01002015.1:10-312(-)